MRKILIVADCNRNRRVFAVRTVFYESQIVKDPTTKVPTVRIYFRLVTACKLLKRLEAAIGIDPMNKDFAILCLTTRLRPSNRNLARMLMSALKPQSN